MSSFLESQFSLSGKVALVTGGARGLGEMIARALLQAGAKVYITSRKVDDLNAKIAELAPLGECEGLVADLAAMEGIEALAAAIAEKESSLDILVNNSGKTWGAPLEAFPEKAWDDVMATNVKAPFYLVQKLLPVLQADKTARQPCHIINIGSVAGFSADSLSAYPYGASKAAVHHLTKVLAKDLVKHHIHVNAIAPGSFPSKMTAGVTKTEEAKAQWMQTIPMGRMGDEDDIGGLIIYLCSSRYMTGSVIALDGGSSLS